MTKIYAEIDNLPKYQNYSSNMNCVTRYQSGHTFTECTGGNAWLIPVYIIFGLFIIYICIKILRKIFSSNNFNSNLLEEYVLWHRNNKDASASIGNSYQKGNFLIVKDKFGNVLDEVEPRVIKYRLTGDIGDLDDLLEAYIEFYNQKNKKKADIMNSKKKGDDFILCDLFNKVIKKINVDDCFNELTHGKFVKD